MKCFLTFWALFHKICIFEVAKFYLTKYQISNQLKFLVVVCICKIHVFNEVIPSCKISGSCHPYLMDLFEIFTSGRYHRDMKALKILASNPNHFKMYRIFNKWQIGVPRLAF